MDKNLNIVVFENPYPPNYGGVIDVYYKIEALAKTGLKIHLHIFSNNNSDVEPLKKICEKVYIYKRKKVFFNQIALLPYIVKSRISSKLNQRLSENKFPILFEGLHSTSSLIHNEELFERSIIRHHNIEHEYYKGLYESEKNIFKKLYYFIESKKLKNYLIKIKKTAYHLAISEPDSDYLLGEGFNNVITILPFHSSHKKQLIKNIDKPFILYHGNLNVAENKSAVDYLLNEIFIDKNKKYVIAGLNADINLKNKFINTSNIELIENPTSEKIEELVQTARVIVLPTFQSTGIKLKLIDSLYKGNHVIVNQQMIKGFPMPSIVSIGDTSQALINIIDEKINNPLLPSEKNNRLDLLNKFFDNDANAGKMVEIINNL